MGHTKDYKTLLSDSELIDYEHVYISCLSFRNVFILTFSKNLFYSYVTFNIFSEKVEYNYSQNW